jgi:hypothetical protein
VQLMNLPSSENLQAIETTLQTERILRYLPAANMDTVGAFRLYLWNCALCEAFYISLHFSEIVCRNAIHKRLVERCGNKWFENQTFLGILDNGFNREVLAAIDGERRQHGARLTSHHIVSALNFAFWEHLMTKRFERLLWRQGILGSFPNAPTGIGREDIRRLIETVRRWRNRIAHHRAIFDKGPSKKHQDALLLIQWACRETGEWVAASSKVPSAIALRPNLSSN